MNIWTKRPVNYRIEVHSTLHWKFVSFATHLLKSLSDSQIISAGYYSVDTSLLSLWVLWWIHRLFWECPFALQEKKHSSSLLQLFLYHRHIAGTALDIPSGDQTQASSRIWSTRGSCGQVGHCPTNRHNCLSCCTLDFPGENLHKAPR